MNIAAKLSEVVSPRIGELRLRDVSAWLSEVGMDGFTALVLQPDGPPLRTRVRIAQRWAGRGWHYMLGCPRCGEPTRTLLARDGELLCEGCHGYLTERQRQRSSREWKRERGEVFDRVIRSLAGATAGKERLREVDSWARALARAEEARVEEMEHLTTAALDVVEECSGLSNNHMNGEKR